MILFCGIFWVHVSGIREERKDSGASGISTQRLRVDEEVYEHLGSLYTVMGTLPRLIPASSIAIMGERKGSLEEKMKFLEYSGSLLLIDRGVAIPSQQHSLVFSVKQRNLDLLPSLIQEVSFGPNGPPARPHYSREELAALTANPEASQAIVEFLQKGNIKVVDEGPFGEHIRAVANISTWAKLLHAEFRRVEVTYKTYNPKDYDLLSNIDESRTINRALRYSLPLYLREHVNEVDIPFHFNYTSQLSLMLTNIKYYFQVQLIFSTCVLKDHAPA